MRHIVLGTLKAFVCLGPVLPSVSEVSNHLGCRETQPFASSVLRDWAVHPYREAEKSTVPWQTYGQEGGLG